MQLHDRGRYYLEPEIEISETSLTNINEAPEYHRPDDYGDCLLRNRPALMAGGVGPPSNNDACSIAATSTCASLVTRSVRCIVGNNGMDRGEISSIIFYEIESSTAATTLNVAINNASYLSSEDREKVDSPTSMHEF